MAVGVGRRSDQSSSNPLTDFNILVSWEMRWHFMFFALWQDSRNRILMDKMEVFLSVPEKGKIKFSWLELSLHLYFLLKTFRECPQYRCTDHWACLNGRAIGQLSFSYGQALGIFFFFHDLPEKSRTFAQTGQVCHKVLLSLCVKWKWLSKWRINDSSLHFLVLRSLLPWLPSCLSHSVHPLMTWADSA